MMPKHKERINQILNQLEEEGYEINQELLDMVNENYFSQINSNKGNPDQLPKQKQSPDHDRFGVMLANKQAEQDLRKWRADRNDQEANFQLLRNAGKQLFEEQSSFSDRVEGWLNDRHNRKS